MRAPAALLDADSDTYPDQTDPENENSCVPDLAQCPQVPAAAPIHRGALALLLLLGGAVVLAARRRR